MLRRLRSAAVLISFIAFVGLITLWVRSYWVAESNWWQQKSAAAANPAGPDSPTGAYVGILSDWGKVVLGGAAERTDGTTISLAGRWEHTYKREEDVRGAALDYILEHKKTWGRFGFYFINTDPYSTELSAEVATRYWALTLVAAIVPGIWLIRFLRSRQCLVGGFPVEVNPVAMAQSGGVAWPPPSSASHESDMATHPAK